MKALVLNCSLKKSGQDSSTEALSKVLMDELKKRGSETEIIRVADYNVLPGVSSDQGQGDDWPKIRAKVLASDILILASPTWVGRLSSIAQRVIERMDAFLSEKDKDSRPVAYNRVAGFVALGNEDGAKHVIGEMAASLIELGFKVPGQSWTYYNNGAPMGPPYIEITDDKKKQRAHRNAVIAATVLVAAAQALKANPIPAPDI